MMIVTVVSNADLNSIMIHNLNFVFSIVVMGKNSFSNVMMVTMKMVTDVQWTVK